MKAKQADPLEQPDFRKCVAFHGHVCPGLATGYRAARAGMDWLDEHRAEDEEVVAVVETDSCAADAVQVLTGCTFGKGNFFFDDQGKMAFTFLSRSTGRGVRLVRRSAGHGPAPGDRHGELMDRVRAGEATPEEQEAFQRMHLEKARDVLNKPLEELFVIRPVQRSLPPKARIEPSRVCEGCGEAAMATRITEVNGRSLCRACSSGGAHVSS